MIQQVIPVGRLLSQHFCSDSVCFGYSHGTSAVIRCGLATLTVLLQWFGVGWLISRYFFIGVVCYTRGTCKVIRCGLATRTVLLQRFDVGWLLSRCFCSDLVWVGYSHGTSAVIWCGLATLTVLLQWFGVCWLLSRYFCSDSVWVGYFRGTFKAIRIGRPVLRYFEFDSCRLVTLTVLKCSGVGWPTSLCFWSDFL